MDSISVEEEYVARDQDDRLVDKFLLVRKRSLKWPTDQRVDKYYHRQRH